MDVYKTTTTNQIIRLARNLPPYFSLVRVANNSPSNLFLASKQTGTLSIYKIPLNTYSLTIEQLDLCLSQRVSNFIHKDYLTYYLFANTALFYQEQGNLGRFDLVTGHTTVYNFNGMITSIYMAGDYTIFGKDKQEQVYFVDLSWVNKDSNLQAKAGQNVSIVGNEVGLALCRPILKNTKSSLFLKFEGDSVAQTTAAFIDATKLMVFGCMNKPLVTCDGSHGFKERFIAFNTYGDDYSPSFFNASLSALDAHSGIIKTWSLGTGKVMQVHQQSEQEKEEFNGYKHHNCWAGSNLVVKRPLGGNDSFWCKLIIKPQSITLQCKFTHNPQLSSSVFTSSDNKLLIELASKVAHVFQLLSSSGGNSEKPNILKSYPLTKISLSCPEMKAPINFSPDFTQYLDYSDGARYLSFFKLPRHDESMRASMRSEYQRFDAKNMPYLELIAFDKKSGLRLIQFESCDRIRYVNKHFVEQSLPINVEIDETQSNLIRERFAGEDGINLKFFRSMTDLTTSLDF